MPGIAHPVPRRRPGNERLKRQIKPSPRASKRLSPSAGLASLGRGCGDALPTLQSVPASFRLELNGELLYSLCIGLVERKLVDEQLWIASGKIPVVFARNAIQKKLESFLKLENVDYSLEVCDVPDSSYGSADDALPSSLFVMFELQSTGVLVIGEAMEALDAQEEKLGAAFYVVLISALWRWMYLYDHTSAERYSEQMQEMREDDDPDNQDHYEIPDVEKAIPPAVKEVDNWPVHTARRLLRKHRNSPCGDWIRRLFRIATLARIRYKPASVENYYDAPPGPSFAIVFKEHDAIHACLDEDLQNYYESSHEPTCAVRFRPDRAEEFDQALRTAVIFLRLNQEMSELVGILNEWGEQHASRDQHRPEPALRAA